jgi:hypothetical protein
VCSNRAPTAVQTSTNHQIPTRRTQHLMAVLQCEHVSSGRCDVGRHKTFLTSANPETVVRPSYFVIRTLCTANINSTGLSWLRAPGHFKKVKGTMTAHAMDGFTSNTPSVLSGPPVHRRIRLDGCLRPLFAHMLAQEDAYFCQGCLGRQLPLLGIAAPNKCSRGVQCRCLTAV